MTPQEREFWEQNQNHSVVLNRRCLADLMSVPINTVNRRALREYIYRTVGIQPHEFMVQHASSYLRQGYPVYEIRFASAECMALLKLSGVFDITSD